MLSKVAENIYWMARYVERAENIARLISVNANLLLDLPKGVAPGWEPLIWITEGQALYDSLQGDYSEQAVLRFLIGEKENQGSLLNSLAAARENARTIRDIIPREAWEYLNCLFLSAKENLHSGLTKGGRFTYLNQIILGSQTLTGLLASTMLRDQGYSFLRCGRNLERADMTTRIIDVRSANLLPSESELRPFESIQWVSVLKSMTGYQMYRRNEQIRVTRTGVLRFLFQERDFPRSVMHCVEVVEEAVTQLPRNQSILPKTRKLKKMVMAMDIPLLKEDQGALHAFIDEVQLALAQLHDEMSNTWFLWNLVEPSKAVVGQS